MKPSNVVLCLAVLVLGYRPGAAAPGPDDFEVINLPRGRLLAGHNGTVPVTFRAFGRRVDLLLRPNKNLVAGNFEVWKRGPGNESIKIDAPTGPDTPTCHYIHEDSISTAAMNLCEPGLMRGLVFFGTESFEIGPLGSGEGGPRLQRIHRRSSTSSSSSVVPHLLYRRTVPSMVHRSRHLPEEAASRRTLPSDIRNKDKDAENELATLTIELAVFLDAAAYELLVPRVVGDEGRLLELLLAYVNNIQALYHHRSLGRPIDLGLVRLELLERQPPELMHLDGERGQLLDTFCAYAKSRNPAGDEDPRHWDLGLYLSGLDFYALESGKRNPVTMGLAPVGGVCWPEYSCVIVEFGVSNRFGKPYPSAGFTSIYIAAHEIAHNLGMHHDSTGNDCPRDGFIMSPSRGTEGETQWSSCSRDVARSLGGDKPCLLDRAGELADPRLEHGLRYGGRPGRSFDAKRQCELLLRDRDAYAESLEDACRALRCRSPSRAGFYLAGPALDGTSCGPTGAECTAGECLPTPSQWSESTEGPPTSTTTTSTTTTTATTTTTTRTTTGLEGARGWSQWSEGKCESGCIRGSVGYLARTRICAGREEGCPGLGTDVDLCKDVELCEGSQRKRLSAEEHAGKRCLDYSGRYEEIDGTAGGLQAGHEEARPWVACAVFCKMRGAASYYSPRLELNGLGLDPYFPDGTWCHKDDRGENYFCRRHHCLPESFSFGESVPAEEEEEEEEEEGRLGPMNAGPGAWRPDPELRRYFGLDLEGKPLLTSLRPGLLEEATAPPRDGESWLDSEDYVEIPLDFLRRRTLAPSAT